VRWFYSSCASFGWYEAIVTRARELHMAGATVLRGPLGFGRSSMLHTEKILRLSQDLPVVIEIVDANEKIRRVHLRGYGFDEKLPDHD
jgi:PII-like signaling protein